MTSTIIASFIVGVLTLPTIRWARERWRTRHDKGYDASKWGAF